MLWFYENDLDRTVTQVLRQMLFRIRPGNLPGLQGNVLGLSVGVVMRMVAGVMTIEAFGPWMCITDFSPGPH